MFLRQQSEPFEGSSLNQSLLIPIHCLQGPSEASPRASFHFDKNELIELLSSPHDQINLPSFRSAKVPIEQFPTLSLQVTSRNSFPKMAHLHVANPLALNRQPGDRVEQRAETSDGGADTAHAA